MANQDVEDQAVLDSAFASDRDRGADTAAPEPAPAKEPAAEPSEETSQEAKPEGEDKDSSKQYRDPETGRFVPLTELKTERGKRQEEARLRAEAEQRAIAAEAALYEARRYASQFQQQQHQPQPQQQSIPDPFSDPEGYQQYVVGQAQASALNERLNMSQMLAEEKHGSEKVQKALQAAVQAGVQRHFVQARNPYGDLVQWYDRQVALSEIGPDPSAYRTKLEQQIREKVLAELKQGQASPQQRFPGTLADAPASGAQGAMLSDQAMLDSAYASDRHRRR